MLTFQGRFSCVSIYGNSSGNPLICSFFKEEIRLASPIPMKTREEPTPSSDLDWPKENTQTIIPSSLVMIYQLIHQKEEKLNHQEGTSRVMTDKKSVSTG